MTWHMVQDADYMTNGSLDVKSDLEPASMKGMRLRDLPSHVRTTEKDNPVFGFIKRIITRCSYRPIIFNTFKALDHEVLKDLSEVLIGPIYTVGPLQSLSNNLALHESEGISDIGSNILKEDSQCLRWLDSQNPNSVVYASFGSTTTMTNEQLIEFAWGLANSKHPFLWVIRPDIIIGQSAILPVEFEMEAKGRGILVSWCPQQKVLNHPSVGVYLTHSGWNSTLETISSGVPVICWPYKGDHQPISWWSCYKWGIGKELDIFVKRDQVEKHIKEVLEEEKGKMLKLKAMEWKHLADEATSSNGSSSLDIDRFIDYVASLHHVENGLTI
ncbi:7-deoxyloganetin glucosyltransferase-like isoform X1 [Silene latifolia]|uniref:7-deoxyloganetin glucosyltransferase-like isoform X1 n=2 Tax=Silene latifolia TaxID=37657 RepID=UPI003D771197